MSGERKEIDAEEQLPRAPLLFSFRSLISGIVFLYCLVVYLQRFNLSVAIVCMMNHTALSLSAGSTENKSQVKFSDCGQSAATNETIDMEDGELFWAKDTQGLVLGAFFWGYITTQVAGGVLSLRFGADKVLGTTMFIGSLCALACPPAARLHFGALMALRVIMGACQGVTFPAAQTLFSRWAPPNERNRLVGLAFGGVNVGSIISMLSGGFLCRFGFAGGWPSIFYISGMLGILLTILWAIFVSDGPRTNRWISKAESRFIERSLRERVKQERVVRVPVRSMITSLPVYALIVAHTCSDWGNYLFLTQLPTYLREVTGYTITKNGALSALPYIAKVGVVILITSTADFLRSREICSTTVIRKIFNSLGLLPLALFAIITTLLPCAFKDVAVALLVIGIAFTGCVHSAGYSLNPTDLAPQFAGIIFGISNTLGTVTGIAAPSAVSALTPQRTRLQWNTVLYITAAIYTFGSLFFIAFGSGELQQWGKPQPDNDEKKEEKKKERKKSSEL